MVERKIKKALVLPFHRGFSSEECPAGECPDTLLLDSTSSSPKCDYVLDADEDGEFCVIPLTQDYFVKIDPEDYEDISQFKWRLSKNKTSGLFYAKRNVPKSESGTGKRTTEYVHRRIMRVEKGVLLDHKNRNGLDCRKGNLRIADYSENGWNQKKGEGLTSKYKGVDWKKPQGKWRVQIGYRGKIIYIGLFEKKVVDGVDIGEIEAAKAYDRAAVKHFGVFARLNFPISEQEKIKGVEQIASILKGKKMSYVMDEKTRKQTEKKINELWGQSGRDLAEILGSRTIAELENMCKVLECNISELSTRIRRS